MSCVYILLNTTFHHGVWPCGRVELYGCSINLLLMADNLLLMAETTKTTCGSWGLRSSKSAASGASGGASKTIPLIGSCSCVAKHTTRWRWCTSKTSRGGSETAGRFEGWGCATKRGWGSETSSKTCRGWKNPKKFIIGAPNKLFLIAGAEVAFMYRSHSVQYGPLIWTHFSCFM